MGTSYGGQKGDNTRDQHKEAWAVGDFVNYESGVGLSSSCRFTGWVTEVWTRKLKVCFFKMQHRTTGEILPIISNHTGKVLPHIHEVVDMYQCEKLYTEEDKQHTRAVIHQLQLIALDENNKEEFFKLGALLDETL